VELSLVAANHTQKPARNTHAERLHGRKENSPSSYPAIANYCPVQGEDCITGEGTVNFKKSGKKDAAGTYSVEFPSGAKEQSSFRVTLARQGLVICE